MGLDARYISADETWFIYFTLVLPIFRPQRHCKEVIHIHPKDIQINFYFEFADHNFRHCEPGDNTGEIKMSCEITV